MSFFDEEERQPFQRRKSWRDTFVQLVPGEVVTVRIIEPNVTENKIWKHYIPAARRSDGKRGVTVPCPGFEICPVCARNQELKNQRDHPDYVGAFAYYYAHVFDLTEYKVCPLCGTENEGDKCSFDDNDLTDVPVGEPRLKILEGSKTFFQQINTIEGSIKALYDPDRPSMYNAHNDPEVQAKYKSGRDVKVPVGVTAYPLNLATVLKDDGKRMTTPIPAGAPDDFDWREYQDQRIEHAWLELTPDEMVQLVKGAALVELLRARNRSNTSTALEDTEDDVIPF